MKSFNKLTLAVCAAFGTLPAIAQNAVLAPLVVSATRSNQTLENATGEVMLVGQEQIASRNPVRLTDVLSDLPGVFVSPGKGIAQSRSLFSLRGISGDNRTLFLLDGVPMNDGFSGSVLLSGISPSQLEQAEVMSGPMSSLYGGNAMGGVVNFVTRRPQKNEFELSVAYGDAFKQGRAEADVKKTNLYAGTRLDNDLSISFNGAWSETNGYRSDWVSNSSIPAGTSGAQRVVSPTGTTSYLLGKRGAADWQDESWSVRAEQHLGDGTRWWAGWMMQAYAYGFGTPETFLKAAGVPSYGNSNSIRYLFGAGDGSYQRDMANVGFESRVADGRLNVALSYTKVSDNAYILPTTSGSYDGGAGRVTNSPSESKNLDVFWNGVRGAHDLTFGVNYRDERAESREMNLSNWKDAGSVSGLYSLASGQTLLKAAYLQDAWQIAPQWVLQGGLRYDHWSNEDGQSQRGGGTLQTYNSRSDAAWSPKIGAAYRAADALSLRASAGKSFHAPAVYDLYRSSTLSTYNILANPELKPETAKTWELGADWKVWQGAELRITYFHNAIQDMIYLGPKVGVAPNVTRARINAGEGVSQGVTIGFSQQVAADGKVFVNLTYTDSEILSNPASSASVGKQFANLPRKQLAAGWEQGKGDWRWTLLGRYASKQYALDDNSDVGTGYTAYDPYFVADAKVAYRIDRHFSAALAVNNLFDREYFSYYPAPGRSWLASLSYRY